MLRSLARNGFDRSIVIQHHTQTFASSRYASTALFSLHISRTRRTDAISHSFQRFLSSPAPAPHDKTAKSPPPPVPPLRKPKVDLRPGPIKPKTLTATTTATPAPPARVGSSEYRPADTKVKLSALEEANKTVEDAQQHGILTPPPPGAGFFGKFAHQAWQLFKFYYRGIKMINTHRQRVGEIKRRVKAGGEPMTRAEHRFIRVYRDDVKKLVPFIIIVIVLEEVIPLIALYAPFMLPSTCVLPSQRSKIEEKRTEKAVEFARRYKRVYEQLQSKVDAPLSSLLATEVPIAMCGLLRLSTYGFDALRTRRIQRHYKYIIEDDEFLIREDMGAYLSQAELNEALEERGIILRHLNSKDQLQSRLQSWLKSVQTPDPNDPIARRLLVSAKSLVTK